MGAPIYKVYGGSVPRYRSEDAIPRVCKGGVSVSRAAPNRRRVARGTGDLRGEARRGHQEERRIRLPVPTVPPARYGPWPPKWLKAKWSISLTGASTKEFSPSLEEGQASPPPQEEQASRHLFGLSSDMSAGWGSQVAAARDRGPTRPAPRADGSRPARAAIRIPPKSQHRGCHSPRAVPGGSHGRAGLWWECHWTSSMSSTFYPGIG